MVVCKFFLLGYCRFGDNCKFEHQINDTYNTTKNQHNSILWQSQLGNSQYQNQNNAIFHKQNNPVGSSQDMNPSNSSEGMDVDNVIKSIVNDMRAIEKGGQWLLSCYGPFKDKPVFPSFEDYCFEEIRSGFYESVKSGTLEHYKQHVNGLLQHAMLRIKSLQKPTAEIKEILKNLYNTPLVHTISSSNSIFGNTNSRFSQSTFAPPNTSLFTQSNQTLFSKPSVQTPAFSGNPGSIFGSPTLRNSSQVINQNIFAQANANLGPQNSGSIFSNQSKTITPTTSTSFPASPFFGQPSPQPNIFSNQKGNIFHQSAVATTPNIFGNQNKVQQFSPQETQPSTIFGGNQNLPNIFPQQSQQGSIFANRATENVDGLSLFQTKTGETGQNSNVFETHLNAPSFDESLYSKPENLTEDEIKWFQSDELDPMKIPEKPPTFEMCFKT